MLPLPGPHLPTNAARQLLTHAGLRDPRTGEPISAALALGVSGGLGCGYILWQFKGALGTVLTLGFTYRWNYGKEAVDALIRRLGGAPRWVETGSRKRAQTELDRVLDAGQPAAVWLDQVNLGYLRQPDHLDGCFGWHATVWGRAGEQYLLHDLGSHTRAVSRDCLAAARARIGSHKHRMLTVDALAEADWAGAVRAGVADHTRYLSESSQSFSIPAVRKWARLVTDARNKKGWRAVFPGGVGLASALFSTYNNIAHGLSDGTGLRQSWSQFCTEGADLAAWPALADCASDWAEAGARWAAVADCALPVHGPLGALRQLADQKRSLLSSPPSAATEGELDQVCSALAARQAGLDAAWPAEHGAVEDHLDALSTALLAVVDCETAAVARLRALS